MHTDRLNDEISTILTAKTRSLAHRQTKTPQLAVIDLARLARRPIPVLNIVTEHEPALLIGQITHTETYDPVAAALRFVRDGVDALAMFTDQRIYSQGLDDMLLVSRGMKCPLICQDYILNEYHVAEARAAGASALVLYASLLERPALRRVVSTTQRWRMTSIVQVSSMDELLYAATLSPHVIAVGTEPVFDRARDLPLLQALCPAIPFNTRVMPLGCLQTLDDVAAVARLKVDAVIVDEKLLKPAHHYDILRDLLDYDGPASEQPSD